VSNFAYKVEGTASRNITHKQLSSPVPFLVFTSLKCPCRYALESCAARVDLRGLRVPAFAWRVWEPAELCARVRRMCGVELPARRERVLLDTGAMRARVEKFFVRGYCVLRQST